MEVWRSPALGFDAVHGKVRIYGDGNQPISWISYRDVARAAAAAVDDDKARNMVVELGGLGERFHHCPIRRDARIAWARSAVDRIATRSRPFA
jgi:nucleoside-diphosphate-sugar epimerase